MTPENAAKQALKDTIARVAAELGGDPPYIENRGSTPFGLPGVDTHMLFHGRYFAIEVKRFDGKGKVKGRQLEILERVRDAGGVAMVVDSEGQLALFEAVMRGAEKPPTLNPVPQVNLSAQASQMLGNMSSTTTIQRMQANAAVLLGQYIHAQLDDAMQKQRDAIDAAMRMPLTHDMGQPARTAPPPAPLTIEAVRRQMAQCSSPEEQMDVLERWQKDLL
jgi:hypothetical protein